METDTDEDVYDFFYTDIPYEQLVSDVSGPLEIDAHFATIFEEHLSSEDEEFGSDEEVEGHWTHDYPEETWFDEESSNSDSSSISISDDLDYYDVW